MGNANGVFCLNDGAAHTFLPREITQGRKLITQRFCRFAYPGTLFLPYAKQ